VQISCTNLKALRLLTCPPESAGWIIARSIALRTNYYLISPFLATRLRSSGRGRQKTLRSFDYLHARWGAEGAWDRIDGRGCL